jgi:hypothetical protein
VDQLSRQYGWLSRERELQYLSAWVRARGIGPEASEERLRQNWSAFEELTAETVALIKELGTTAAGLCCGFDVIDEAPVQGRIDLDLVHHAAYHVVITAPFVFDAVVLNRDALAVRLGVPVALRIILDFTDAGDSGIVDCKTPLIQ